MHVAFLKYDGMSERGKLCVVGVVRWWWPLHLILQTGVRWAERGLSKPDFTGVIIHGNEAFCAAADVFQANICVPLGLVDEAVSQRMVGCHDLGFSSTLPLTTLAFEGRHIQTPAFGSLTTSHTQPIASLVFSQSEANQK